jgi:hypothetical protein
MPRYLAKACPRCEGYVGIVIREPGRNCAAAACEWPLLWVFLSHGVDCD